jgi:hypothetical protein
MEGKGLLPREGVITLSLDALVVTKESLEISSIMKTGPGLKQKTSAMAYQTEEIVKGAIKKVTESVKE